jgi:hypothetical protein
MQVSEWKQLYAEVLDREAPAGLSQRIALLAADAQADDAGVGRSRRVAVGLLVGVATVAVLLVLALAAHSRSSAPAPANSSAPRPCAVGTKGCGPLPTVPWDHTPVPSHAPDRGAPNKGLLRPGAYTSVNWDHTGIRLSVTVPAGWRWDGRTLSKGMAAVSFYSPPVLVYADPCHWDQPQHPVVTPALASGDVIISELAAQPLRYAAPPQGLPVDQRAIRLTVPSNLDVSKCDHGQYRTWGTGANTLLAHGPGQRDLIWIQYLGFVQGKTLMVDARTFPNTPTHLVHQVDAILAKSDACVQCG